MSPRAAGAVVAGPAAAPPPRVRIGRPEPARVERVLRELARQIDGFELPAIEKLCTLLQCPVGDLLEVVPDTLPTTLPGGRP